MTTASLNFTGDNTLVTIGNTSVNLNKDYTGDIAGLAADLTAAFQNTEGVTVSGSGTSLTFSGTAGFTTAVADGNVIGGAAGDGAAKLTGAGAATGTTTGSTISSLKDTALSGTGGVQTQAAAKAAITSVDNAIKTVSGERAKLGAYQNRLEHTINNLGTSSENLTAAESRVRDVDMAKEMMTFSKNNILSQAAQAMISQANQQPQGVLQLLR
ncbi:putative flagellin YvzB [compost metagenome]